MFEHETWEPMTLHVKLTKLWKLPQPKKLRILCRICVEYLCCITCHAWSCKTKKSAFFPDRLVGLLVESVDFSNLCYIACQHWQFKIENALLCVLFQSSYARNSRSIKYIYNTECKLVRSYVLISILIRNCMVRSQRYGDLCGLQNCRIFNVKDFFVFLHNKSEEKCIIYPEKCNLNFCLKV